MEAPPPETLCSRDLHRRHQREVTFLSALRLYLRSKEVLPSLPKNPPEIDTAQTNHVGGRAGFPLAVNQTAAEET